MRKLTANFATDRFRREPAPAGNSGEWQVSGGTIVAGWLILARSGRSSYSVVMLFSEWIDVTQRVLSREGDDPLLPTVGDPRNGHVRILEGIPPAIPATIALQEWITQLGLTEFFFAVSETPRRIVSWPYQPTKDELRCARKGRHFLALC